MAESPVFVKHGKNEFYPARLVNVTSHDEVEDGRVRIRWDSGRKEDVLGTAIIRIDQIPRRRRLKPQRLGLGCEDEGTAKPLILGLGCEDEGTVINLAGTSSSDSEGTSSEDSKGASSSDSEGASSLESSDEGSVLKQKAAIALNGIPGFNSEEVDIALDEVGPPFGLQTTMKHINELRHRSIMKNGFKIRRFFSGVEHEGSVVAGPSPEIENTKLLHWLVKYKDGVTQTMTYDDLMRWRANRPQLQEICRGRPLQMLEFFCGSAVVSQEFSLLKWKTESINIVNWSNAITIMDIRELIDNLPFVPDFVFASLQGEENIFSFLQIIKIMEWVKEKHPHLIVVIENPVGSLKKMPIMKTFTDRFGLTSTTVDFCAFGRDEKKSTMIWTNDWGLRTSLQEFTCKENCQFGVGHHIRHVSDENGVGVIPEPLAEEIAEYINAKFVIDRIRKQKAALVNDDED